MIKQQVLRCLNSRGPVHAHPCSRRLWVNVVGCAAAISAAAAVSVGAPASAEDVTVASAGVGVAAAVGAAPGSAVASLGTAVHAGLEAKEVE